MSLIEFLKGDSSEKDSEKGDPAEGDAESDSEGSDSEDESTMFPTYRDAHSALASLERETRTLRYIRSARRSLGIDCNSDIWLTLNSEGKTLFAGSEVDRDIIDKLLNRTKHLGLDKVMKILGIADDRRSYGLFHAAKDDWLLWINRLSVEQYGRFAPTRVVRTLVPDSKHAEPAECGYDKWSKSMLKQVGIISDIGANAPNGDPIPRPHQIVMPFVGVTYWICLDVGNRHQSPRRYVVDEFAVWKLLRLRHSYAVSLRDSGIGGFRVIGARGIDTLENDPSRLQF
jgi:hypothetical protein